MELFLISQIMKRWKNTKNIDKHFIPDIVEAGAYNNKMKFILNFIFTQGTGGQE
jgi:hypothetical protein